MIKYGATSIILSNLSKIAEDPTVSSESLQNELDQLSKQLVELRKDPEYKQSPEYREALSRSRQIRGKMLASRRAANKSGSYRKSRNGRWSKYARSLKKR